MSLYTIPIRVNPTQWSLMVVLSDDNLGRIVQYDPAEIAIADLKAAAGEGFADLELKEVFISFATAEEFSTVTLLCNMNRVREALKLLTRGYTYRRDQGDGRPPRSAS